MFLMFGAILGVFVVSTFVLIAPTAPSAAAAAAQSPKMLSINGEEDICFLF